MDNTYIAYFMSHKQFIHKKVYRYKEFTIITHLLQVSEVKINWCIFFFIHYRCLDVDIKKYIYIFKKI